MRMKFTETYARKSSAAFGIVLSQDKRKILLVKRKDVPIWVLPGGGIDRGESPEDAALREVLEETGAHCRIVRAVAVYSPQGAFTETTHLFEMSEAEPGTSKLIVTDESVDVGFFPLDRLPAPFFPVHQQWIDDALLDRKDLIRKPIEGVTLANIFFFGLKHPLLLARFFFSRLRRFFSE